MSFTRRTLLTKALATGGLLAAPGLVRAENRRVRIGYISALSGPRAEFGTADPWMLTQVRGLLAAGLTVGGVTHEVEILSRDNESNPNRSSEVGADLILREDVDLLLVQDLDASIVTGEMSDMAGIPAISTMGPWQAWVYGRGATPEAGFPWSFTFFWGVDAALGTFVRMWDQVATNRQVGDFYFDNAAGRAFSDPALGLPALMAGAGYRRTPGGLYQIDTTDFAAQVSQFQQAGADIVTGFGFATHWASFWAQAGQAGYHPKVASFAAAFLFPSAIEALGARGEGMTTEVWWSPQMPWRSSLTGQSAAELARAYEADTGRQWLQTLGYSHALFETGIAALKASGAPKDRAAVRAAIAGMTLDTVVGRVDWAGSPIPNVAQTAVAGGQWRRAKRFAFDLHITETHFAPGLTPDGETLALPVP